MLRHNLSLPLWRKHGFTLIELTMVIVVLGILSTAVLPKFFNVSTFQQRSFFDDTLAAIRYAQKLAVATGCNVQVNIASNQYQLKRPGATDRSNCSSTTASHFTQAVPRPATSETNYVGNQSGVTVSDSTIYFTAKGTASVSATVTVGSRSIAIVKDTGFVYDSTP